MKNLIGRGSGESVQLAFQGQGWVLVQPSEGRITASRRPVERRRARVAAERLSPRATGPATRMASRGRSAGGVQCAPTGAASRAGCATRIERMSVPTTTAPNRNTPAATQKATV